MAFTIWVKSSFCATMAPIYIFTVSFFALVLYPQKEMEGKNNVSSTDSNTDESRVDRERF